MMTKNERKLTADFLDLASDEFSNHTCNDVPDEMFKKWTLEERKEFVKNCRQFHNCDPEDYDEDDLHVADWMILDYIADKIRRNE
jgi:hypothetical protein